MALSSKKDARTATPKAPENTPGKKKLNKATAKANEDVSKEYRPRKGKGGGKERGM